MARWQNFQIWRGRLPHWRADDVTYYVTFRHKRPLEESERNALFRRLIGADGKRLEYVSLCILPEATEMMFTVCDAPKGGKYELSDVVEKAKSKAGKDIIKHSGERWPPFYTESFDRIIRDESEYEDTFQKILESPVDSGLCEDPSDWPDLYVPNSPT
ncbi:MAG TPA: hypothetical protein VNI20_11640 [Fimbriimonadaceae bacterium]|nr:hypothetical protein [Fimbriimonadaceae bacterium]